MSEHEALIADVVYDLQARTPLSEHWVEAFRGEAREFARAIAGRSRTLEADLRVWARDVWRDYAHSAAEEQAAALAEERRREDEPKAARRARLERLWASPHRRRDADRLRAIVEARQIGVVYHWTEAENLPSIIKHGICSRSLRSQLGLTPRTHSYGSALKEEQLAGFVGVTFRPQEGMINRAINPIVLELEPAVLVADRTLFVAVNSANSEINLADPEHFSTLDAFGALFEEPHGGRLRSWQAEAWIPERIDPFAITAVAARSDEIMDQLSAQWDRLFDMWPNPPLLVQTEEWNRLSWIDIARI